jgi:hypothetical protein
MPLVLGIGGTPRGEGLLFFERAGVVLPALLFFERAVLLPPGLLFLSRGAAIFFGLRFGLFAPLALIGGHLLSWRRRR